MVRCLLSHKPTDSDCVVLVVNHKNTVFWYCRPKGHTWFKHEYQSSMISTNESFIDVITWLSNLTAIKGKFYTYLPNDEAIVTLEFMPEPTFTTTPVNNAPNSSCFYQTSINCFLESCGELFSCHSSILWYILGMLFI